MTIRKDLSRVHPRGPQLEVATEEFNEGKYELVDVRSRPPNVSMLDKRTFVPRLGKQIQPSEIHTLGNRSTEIIQNCERLGMPITLNLFNGLTEELAEENSDKTFKAQMFSIVLVAPDKVDTQVNRGYLTIERYAMNALMQPPGKAFMEIVLSLPSQIIEKCDPTGGYEGVLDVLSRHTYFDKDTTFREELLFILKSEFPVAIRYMRKTKHRVPKICELLGRSDAEGAFVTGMIYTAAKRILVLWEHPNRARMVHATSLEEAIHRTYLVEGFDSYIAA